jgi:hypothetical protein
MTVGFNTWVPKEALTKFVVRNVSRDRKKLRIFNCPLEAGQEKDLLSLPHVSEADIRSSLLKGELFYKIKCDDITIIDSSIDLVQYEETQRTFLQNAGVTIGVDPGDSGSSSGSDSTPVLTSGPYVTNHALTTNTLLTRFTPTQLGLANNSSATFGLRLIGYSTTGRHLVVDTRVDLNNINGELSALGFALDAEITSNIDVHDTGWSGLIKLSADGDYLEFYGTTTASTSSWRIDVWRASVTTLDNSGVTDTSPAVTLATDGYSYDQVIDVYIMATAGVTNYYLSEVAALPESPTWLTEMPTTFTLSLEDGYHSVYLWGRTAAGIITSSSSSSIELRIDTTAPIITSFSIPSSSASLTVDITSLTSNEDVTWYLNETGTLPETPAWSTAPDTWTFTGVYDSGDGYDGYDGYYTLYAWARDVSGNVSNRASDAVYVSLATNIDYYNDTFDTLNAGWTGYDGGSVTVSNGDLVRSDYNAYRQVYNNVENTLPSDYYMTWIVPEATVANDYLGFTLQRADDNTGIQLFWEYPTGNRNNFVIGAGTLVFMLSNLTFTVDGSIPASWAQNQTHHITLQKSGTTYVLYLDGQRYGYVTTSVNSGSGFGIGVSGAGGNKRYHQVIVSNYLPSYPL